MKKPIALFDLDNTLCKYDEAIERDYNLAKAPEDPIYSPENRKYPHLRKLVDKIRTREGWWLELEKREEGFEILSVAIEVGFEIHIATQGPKGCPNAWGEKMQWVHKNVPGVKVTVTEDKSFVHGDVLVDDFPDFLDAWLARDEKRYGILCPTKYNQDYEHESVFPYKYSRSDIKERLESIYNKVKK